MSETAASPTAHCDAKGSNTLCWTCQCARNADLAARPAPAGYADPLVAWDRAETDPCERGTEGCSVLHNSRNTECEGW